MTTTVDSASDSDSVDSYDASSEVRAEEGRKIFENNKHYTYARALDGFQRLPVVRENSTGKEMVHRRREPFDDVMLALASDEDKPRDRLQEVYGTYEGRALAEYFPHGPLMDFCENRWATLTIPQIRLMAHQLVLADQQLQKLGYTRRNDWMRVPVYVRNKRELAVSLTDNVYKNQSDEGVELYYMDTAKFVRFLLEEASYHKKDWETSLEFKTVGRDLTVGCSEANDDEGRRLFFLNWANTDDYEDLFVEDVVVSQEKRVKLSPEE